MSVSRNLIRIHAMKINYLLSILIILLAVSSSHQRSIAGLEKTEETVEEEVEEKVEEKVEEEVESLATPWSEEDSPITGERGMMSASDDENMAEATPWP